jgi:peptidoglycan/xylan/chitin deacetylase (PgdA/CDA1 family)
MTATANVTVRRLAADAGKWTGGRLARALDVLGTRNPGSFGILLYHRINEKVPGVPTPTKNVTPGRFTQQMEGLLQEGFLPRSLSEVLESVRSSSPVSPRAVVVTFDDGYRNFYREAFPTLRRLGIPVTVFLATSFIDGREAFPFDQWGRTFQRQTPASAWQPLSWDECREMQETGLVEFGSHSHSHQNFARSPERLESDLRQSLTVLEHRLGPGRRPFAYPFGSGSGGFARPELAEICRRCGTTCALTTQIQVVDPRSDPFMWGRLEVMGSDTPAVIRSKLDGWYSWMDRTREVFQSVGA